LVALSEQQLVDCDPLDLGCSGGLMDNAFLFDENSTGICSEADYPYVRHKRWFRGCASAKGLCEPQNHTRIDTFVDVKTTVDALVAAFADQPVSIAIEADQQSFQFYKKVCTVSKYELRTAILCSLHHISYMYVMCTENPHVLCTKSLLSSLSNKQTNKIGRLFGSQVWQQSRSRRLGSGVWNLGRWEGLHSSPQPSQAYFEIVCCTTSKGRQEEEQEAKQQQQQTQEAGAPPTRLKIRVLFMSLRCNDNP
jgi:hypothetical protein